jgi:hypothetical protein
MDETVEMICRQTSYTYEEAAEKLAELKDPLRVIQLYMNPKAVPLRNKNTHQMIFHEINKFVEQTSAQPIRK